MVLRTMRSGTAQTCITSPPYFGLRDYGTGEWEGGDPSCGHAHPLAGDVGQAQASSTLTGARTTSGHAQQSQGRACARCGAVRTDDQLGLEDTPDEYVANLVRVFREVRRVLRDDGTLWLVLGDSYAAKRLLGVPWKVALALQEDGWVLRADVIWDKPNGMPENVDDRPTRMHEYVFLFSKNERYSYSRRGGATRSVWRIATEPFAGDHHGAFPTALVAACLEATTGREDLVLDPFAGTGTTGVVSRWFGRDFLGIELSADYAELARRRIETEGSIPGRRLPILGDDPFAEPLF